MKDVTNKIIFDDEYEEFIMILQCICGKEFDEWDVICLPNNFWKCPECHRRLYIERITKISEVQNEKRSER